MATRRSAEYPALMMRLIRDITCLTLALLALAGCANQDKTAPGGGEGAGWPYWPTEIRIHPLSRLVIDQEAAATVIEARIELRDRDGYTCRGCGQLRLDLAPYSLDESAQPVATWNLSLDDAEFNRERYDKVTRTYLFRLELNAETELPTPAELRAYYLRGDEYPLRAQRLRLSDPE